MRGREERLPLSPYLIGHFYIISNHTTEAQSLRLSFSCFGPDAENHQPEGKKGFRTDSGIEVSLGVRKLDTDLASFHGCKVLYCTCINQGNWPVAQVPFILGSRPR